MSPLQDLLINLTQTIDFAGKSKMHRCEACGEGSLGPSLFEIPDLPLVDSFCATEELATKVPRFSIEVSQCQTCSTIQIASPPDTSAIYKNYIYESSSSPDLESHFAEYASFVLDLSERRGDPVLEIGANDGLLLRQLSGLGYDQLVAVDPSPQTASINLPHVHVVNDFFSHESMSGFEDGYFSTIIANNCFSHIPGLIDILKLCARLLHKKGTLVVEVQSTLDLVEGTIFDYIYHEHYFYHSATSFQKLAGFSGIELYSVQHVATKGGSYRLLLGHPGQHAIHSSVEYWKFREDVAALHTISTWHKLRSYLQNIKHRLHEWLLRDELPLVGFGACATGTVFLNYMGLDSKLVSIVDDNPKRQGLYSPGAAIPVISLEQAAYKSRFLILAWRHQTPIVRKLQDRGSPCLVPLPGCDQYG